MTASKRTKKAKTSTVKEVVDGCIAEYFKSKEYIAHEVKVRFDAYMDKYIGVERSGYIACHTENRIIKKADALIDKALEKLDLDAILQEMWTAKFETALIKRVINTIKDRGEYKLREILGREVDVRIEEFVKNTVAEKFGNLEETKVNIEDEEDSEGNWC